MGKLDIHMQNNETGHLSYTLHKTQFNSHGLGLTVRPKTTVNEKVLNSTNHQENANQNYNEISPHPCQNVYYQ